MATINKKAGREGIKFLFISVGGIEYGIDIKLVQEIIVMPTISPIPSAKPFCKGVINIRGTIVPVIDIRVKLGLDAAEYDEQTCVVVVSISGQRIGVVVDRVKDVAEIPLEDILDSPARAMSSVGKRCVSSKIAKMNGKVKQIIDMDQVLDLVPTADSEEAGHKDEK